MLLFLLAACSNAGGNTPEAVQQAEKTENKAAEVEVEAKAEDSNQTIQYTTIKGEQVEIPADPKRVVYIAQTLGDFLAMGIPVVGNNLPLDPPSYFEDKLDAIVDVGNPGNLEVILTLEPDLIINGYHNADAEHNEALSKIATTIPFNPALPYKERVEEMGRIFNQQEEAAQLIAKFEAQAQQMWDKLQLKEGETATVFYQLGKTLYVLGDRNFGAIIYGENGFAAPPAVQENIIDVKGVSFVTISEELLPEFAGDHLFVISQETDESKTEADKMLRSSIWETLPAVQKGNVYTISDEWNTDNLLALEKVFEKLPQWMERP